MRDDDRIAEILGVRKNTMGIVGRPMPGGFIQYDAADLQSAVSLALEFKANGHYKYFRGQRDSRWQVVSSFVRASHAERDQAIAEFSEFYSFARGAPHLVPYLQTDDALIATAQHYGLAATNFIDFTLSPEVAGWFASDQASSGEEGAIFMVNSAAETALNTLGTSVRFIHLDVPNLWRLQAQQGLFLEAPGTFEHIWPLDRIVFAHGVSSSTIPRRHIYPDMKSALELALDQYQETRRRRVAFESLKEEMRANGVVMLELTDDSNEADNVALVTPPAWAAGPNERWENVDTDTTGPELSEALLSSAEALVEVIEKRRLSTNLVSIPSSASKETALLLDRVWSGMRPHPYSANQISRSIVATLELHRAFKGIEMSNGLEQHKIAELLLGPSTEIEMSTSGENAARAFVNVEALWHALRPEVRTELGPDFDQHGPWLNQLLDERRRKPGLSFDSQGLLELFVDQIIPWQVATRRYPIAFSAFHVLSLGRP